MNTTRTWKCSDCGKTTEISYDWLAEHGGPVCEKCDCDMELQPEATPMKCRRRRTTGEQGRRRRTATRGL